MNILPVAWALLDRGQRRRFLLLQLLSLLMALSTVGGIAIVLPFLTALSDPAAVHRNPLLRFLFEHASSGSEQHFLVLLGFGFLAVTLLANGINLLGSIAMNRFAFRVGDELQTALFDEYLHRGYAFHSSTNSATLSSRVIYESSRLTSGILQSGLLLVANLVTVCFIAASIVLVSPLVASLAALSLGTSYAGTYLLVRGKLHRNGLLESRSHAARSQIVSEGFGAIKEIIVSDIQRYFVEKFEHSCHDISRASVSTATMSQSPRYLIESVAAGALVVVSLQLSGRGGPLLAQISFFGMAAYRLMPALQQAFVAAAMIRADRSAFLSFAADLRHARDRLRESGRGPPRRDHSIWATRPRHDINLSGITFSRENVRSPVFSGLSLRIRAGTTVGFVGANGTGKTTLLDVIGGLLVPQGGRIIIDGIGLDDDNRLAWLTSLAYVPQRVYICDCTLAENIAIGVPYTLIDHDRMRNAARLAGLDSCIATLPHRYDERLGEQGGRLSGGQRQRLGIARALYRDAPLLLLDESTSSLDVQAEHDITTMLQSERRGRTTLMVAHRLSALAYCDIIYELAAGRIARSGTFEEVRDWSRGPLSPLQDHQKVIAHIP